MHEVPAKTPVVEVYKGEQFLFSTDKNSNKQQENVDKATYKLPRFVHIPTSRLGRHRQAIKHKQLGQETGKFSLFAARRTVKSNPLHWFGRREVYHGPVEAGLNSLVKNQDLGGLKLKLVAFKRK
jgi:hypothetical protein